MDLNSLRELVKVNPMFAAIADMLKIQVGAELRVPLDPTGKKLSEPFRDVKELSFRSILDYQGEDALNPLTSAFAAVIDGVGAQIKDVKAAIEKQVKAQDGDIVKGGGTYSLVGGMGEDILSQEPKLVSSEPDPDLYLNGLPDPVKPNEPAECNCPHCTATRACLKGTKMIRATFFRGGALDGGHTVFAPGINAISYANGDQYSLIKFTEGAVFDEGEYMLNSPKSY